MLCLSNSVYYTACKVKKKYRHYKKISYFCRETGCRDFGMPEYRNAGMQEYRDAEKKAPTVVGAFRVSVLSFFDTTADAA